jgi:hypothetical protein
VTGTLWMLIRRNGPGLRGRLQFVDRPAAIRLSFYEGLRQRLTTRARVSWRVIR